MRIASSYHLDLSNLPLDWLREKIATHEIVPACRLLKDVKEYVETARTLPKTLEP